MTDRKGVIETAQPGRPKVTTRAGADLFALSLMFTFLLEAVALSLMPVVTDQLRTSVGLTDAQIGLLTSVFMGFLAVSGILSGIGATRWGGRLLLVSCGCFVAGSFMFALSSGFTGFLVGRAIQGIGAGIVIPTCSSVLAQTLPPAWLGRAWGILGCGFGLGTMATLFIMPSIQSLGGYRTVFLTTAGLAFAVGMLALAQRNVRALPQHPEGTTSLRNLVVSLGAVAVNRRVMLLAVCNTAVLALSVGALAWTPSFLQDVHGSSEAASMYLIAGIGVAQLLGNPLGAAAAGRWGKFWVIVAGLAAMLITTAIVGIMPGAVLASAVVVVAGCCGMLLLPPMLSLLPEVVVRSEQVGPATGINGLMGFAGSLVAPWIFGLLLDTGAQSRGAYIAGYLMLGAFGVVALVGLAFFKAPRPSTSSDEQGRA